MAERPNSKPARRLSPDMIAALSAVLIGVCALGVSLYQATIMREQSELMRAQQKASMWPNVAVENSYRGDAFRLRLVNTGVGPAKIGPVRVTFDQKPIHTWTELILGVHPAQQVHYEHSKVGGRVLPAGDFETVLEVSDPATADAVRTQIDRLAIEICYCSIYGDCWQYVQHFDGEPLRNRVERCQAAEADFPQGTRFARDYSVAG
jgi:hypothetical protein